MARSHSWRSSTLPQEAGPSRDRRDPSTGPVAEAQPQVGVGPVDVLEDENRHPETVDELGQRSKQYIPDRGRVVQRLRRGREILRPLREERPQSAAQRTHAMGVRVRCQAPDAGHHGTQRGRLGHRWTGREQHTVGSRRRAVERRQDLAQQAGLTYPCLALHHHERRATREGACHLAERVVAADQRGRRRRTARRPPTSFGTRRHLDLRSIPPQARFRRQRSTPTSSTPKHSWPLSSGFAVPPHGARQSQRGQARRPTSGYLPATHGPVRPRTRRPRCVTSGSSSTPTRSKPIGSPLDSSTGASTTPRSVPGPAPDRPDRD